MIRRTVDDVRGSVSILIALTLVLVIGFAALALEYGYGLLQKVEDQRIADIAAYTGGLVYNATGSTTSTYAAVNNIVALNAVTSASATPLLLSSPTGDGNQAVKVTVSTQAPLFLARVLISDAALPVSAVAYAEVNTSNAQCIIALDASGSGISLSGTGSLTANDCQVASNSTICANSGANPSDVITTKYLSYNSGASPLSSSCTVTAPSSSTVTLSKKTVADPLAGNNGVVTATSRISTVAATASPAAPATTSGTALTLSSKSKSGSLPSGCNTVSTKSPWTITCSGSGPFNFGALTVSGTATISNSSSGATYNFSGLINSSNSLAVHGGSGATYNLEGGLYVHGSGAASFDAGTFNVGPVATTSDCGNKSNYSICTAGSGSVTFGGSSTFVLAGGIYQKANATLNLGYGTSGNSFQIGKASDGISLQVANGASLLGDATASGNVFQLAGDITGGGGTCMALSAAKQHDINGSIDGAGGIVMGAGVYTINGYVALGNSGGGDVGNCPSSGTTTGLTGLGVTIVVSGASTVSCGSTTSAFCLGAGFSTVKLTAPTSSSTLASATAGLAVIGPQSSSNTAGAVFKNGATNTQISGSFYFPNGPIVMSGAATLQDTVDSGACLQLIGAQITASAGTAFGTSCVGVGGSPSVTIGLVQ